MRIPASFDYPDRLPDEPPANTKQLIEIQELCPNIISGTLASLGKHQATCLIYSIRSAQRVMQQTIDACTDYLKLNNLKPPPQQNEPCESPCLPAGKS
ncbi:MAG: hypothetical protein ACPG32_13155 [Akkermansiaceae bacterium]